MHEKSRLVFINRVIFHPSIIRLPLHTYVGDLEISPRDTEIGVPSVCLDTRGCMALYEL